MHCAMFLVLLALPLGAQVIAVKAGRMLDVERGTVLTDQLIVIRDGKFASTAPAQGAAIPAGAQVVDLSRYTVLPGLIDCHTHLADGYGSPDPVDVLKETAATMALKSATNARKMLLSGFTTVRDVGTYRALGDVALRDAIARGDIIGPRMFVAGAYVTITGGAGALTGIAPDIGLPWDLHYGEANSPWEVRQVIRKLANQNVDLIKVLATGAVLTHGSNPGSVEFTEEELQAAVDEAAHFHLKVAAHAHANAGIRNAINAGVASVEHAEMIDDATIALAKQHGTYFVMDIYDEECIQQEGKEHNIPPDFLQHDAELGQVQRDNFRKAVNAGVKLAFGTDAGVCPYGTSAKQFAFMVKYGMTPMQAIQSATVSAADLIGKPQEFGSIAPGKFADMVAVAGDPLQNISLLESVDFVMKEGKIYKQPGQAEAGIP